jgi:predicted enzyme related to lactoylglutathione lyase
MGTRDGFEHGTFSWAELTSSDGEAAKDFYARVFGWEYDDNPIGEGAVYSMAKQDGRYVGAMFEAADRPVAWTAYVTVDDADAAAERAEQLGGAVMAAPFDVMDAGRMTVIADPQGAVLALWEARGHPGAGLVNAPGALCWNELWTSDPDAAASFYSDLLGWEVDDEGYRLIRNRDRNNGGIQQLTLEMAHVPPNWSVCFGSADIEETVGAAMGAGGQVLIPPTEMVNPTAGQAARFAVLADPQGAPFAVYAGAFDG